MQRFGFTVIKNALANIIRGGATAMVALALPHFLTRALDRDRFAAWALMLQIAAYAAYLDFGVQTAVARYLAQAIERKDDEQRDRLVSTAFVMLSVAGSVALAVFGLGIWQLPHIIHGVPVTLLSELRTGAGVLAVTVSLGLPLSTYTGVLVGLHRNEFPAMAIGGSRVLGALLVLLSINYTHSLVWFAGCLGVCNLIGALIQYFAVRRLLPTLRLRISSVTRSMLHELSIYCSGLTVLSFATLLISGVDVIIVGHYSFSAVGYYAIAATLITFVAGLSNSCFSALMTPVAVLQARGEYGRIRDLIIEVTRLSSYASLLLTVSAFIFGKYLLALWIGKNYEGAVLPIFRVLLCAQAIRLLGNGYFMSLIATGQQKHGVAGALAEGISNFLFSLIGAIWVGPLGVAWGTLLGSVIGAFWMLLFTMRWAKAIPINVRVFTEESLFRPLLCFSPLIIATGLYLNQSAGGLSIVYLLFAILLSGVLSWRWGKVLPHTLSTKSLL